jgi:transcriptional regulator of heat shock response
MEEKNKITKEARLLLLVIIEKNGSIDDLNDMGYEYFQITKFLKEEITNKNAIIDNGDLKLTKKGFEDKLTLMKVLNINKTNRIVLPLFSKIERSSNNDVFIPYEDDLMF